MGNQFSFAGKGSALIRVNDVGTINGVNYIPHEPLAYFTDVMIDVSFSDINKVAKAGTTNLTGSSTSEASYLRITNVKTTESILSLIYSKKVSNFKNISNIYKIESKDGYAYLPVAANETLSDLIFIHTIDKHIRKDDFTFDKTTGTITGLADGIYVISYEIIKEAIATYSLKSPKIQYLSVEISAVGNTNGKNGIFNLHLNRVQLVSVPTIDLNSSEPFTQNLEFVILSDKNDVSDEVNYYGQ